MTTPTRTTGLRLLACAIAGAVTMSGLTPAATAQAADCIGEKISALKMTSTDHQYEMITYYSRDGKVTVAGPYDLRPVTKASDITVTVRTCLVKGKYKVRDYKFSQVHHDMTLTISGNDAAMSPTSGDVGFAGMVKKVTGSKVKITVVRSTKDPETISGWDALRAAMSIPLPMPIPFWLKIGLALGKAMLPSSPPDTYQNTEYKEPAVFAFKITSTGKAKLTTKKVYRHASITWEGVCAGYVSCTYSQRDVVTLKKTS